MSPPRVSIITPSFNQGGFLDEAIRSVLDQDYPNLEYAVMDGGSTDSSLAVIRRYADRLAWFESGPDGGQTSALNAGFGRATGEILGWLNADDALLPDAISTVVAALEAAPEALLAYGPNILVDESRGTRSVLPARPFDLAEMLRTGQNHVPQPGSLFRRRAYELAGPLEESGYYYFDFEFVVKLGLHGPAVQLAEQLAVYRLHPESKSMSAPVAKAEDHLRTYDRIFALPELPPHLRAVEREARSVAQLVAAEYFYLVLQQRRARAAILRSLWLYPRRLSPWTLGLVVKTLLPGRIVRVLRRLRRR